MSFEERFQGSVEHVRRKYDGAQWSRYAPQKKVGVGSVAGALTIIVVWLANNYLLPQGNGITGEVASALTTVLTFLVAYMVPER